MEAPLNGSTDCTKTPIVGPDTPPTFDVQNDDGGCFKTEQSHNNCYNYGTDIVTNDFGQPGMGSGQKWKSNTCEDVQAAAVRDGLTFVGTTLPTAQRIPPLLLRTAHHLRRTRPGQDERARRTAEAERQQQEAAALARARDEVRDLPATSIGPRPDPRSPSISC